MAPHPDRGLAGLVGPASPDLIASGRIAGLEVLVGDLKLSEALAAARLCVAAAADVLGNRVHASADAWTLGVPAGPASSSSGGCPVGFGNPSKLKQYPDVHVPPTLSLLTPVQLLWLYLKNTGIVFLLQTNFWLYQALEAEEQALQQGTQAQLPPYPDVLQQLVKAAWASWRELLTRLTRSELKHWVRASAGSRAAWKILKDPRDSLTNKAVFYLNTPAIQLLPMYTTTMFRTQLPTYAAELIVACAYDAFAELQVLVRLPPRPAPPAPAPGTQGAGGGGGPLAGVLASLSAAQAGGAATLQQLLGGQARLDWAVLPASSRRFGLRAAKNFVRVAGTAVCAAAGAGVAGALAPREAAGTWAFRGLIVSDLVFANVFLLLLDGPLAPTFGEPAGGSHKREAGQQQQQQQAPPLHHHGLPQHPGNDMVQLFHDLTN